MPKRKVKPPAQQARLIRRTVSADGTTILYLRWNAESNWVEVCRASEASTSLKRARRASEGEVLSTTDHPTAELNNLQAVASVPIVRVCYLDAIAPLQADTKRYLTGYHAKLCFPEVLDKKEFVR